MKATSTKLIRIDKMFIGGQMIRREIQYFFDNSANKTV